MNESIERAEGWFTQIPGISDDLVEKADFGRERRRRDGPAQPHLANGSGRSWKCITLLVVPLPVSM